MSHVWKRPRENHRFETRCHVRAVWQFLQLRLYIPSQRHSRIRAFILWDADVADLKLRAGTPDESLYRISGSLRSDPFARIDAWGWYTLSAHLLRSLRRRIFLTPSADRRRTRIYLFPSQNGGWNRHSRITFTTVPNFGDVPFQAFTSWIGFFFALHFETFTILSFSLLLLLSAPDAIFDPSEPRVSPWSLATSPVPSQIDTFYSSRGQAFALMDMSSLSIYLRALAASTIWIEPIWNVLRRSSFFFRCRLPIEIVSFMNLLSKYFYFFRDQFRSESSVFEYFRWESDSSSTFLTTF